MEQNKRIKAVAYTVAAPTLPKLCGFEDVAYTIAAPTLPKLCGFENVAYTIVAPTLPKLCGFEDVTYTVAAPTLPKLCGFEDVAQHCGTGTAKIMRLLPAPQPWLYFFCSSFRHTDSMNLYNTLFLFLI
jgi:hypothetical protein